MPARLPVAATMTPIARQRWRALFIDYGDWRSHGDTLQALRAHAFADPLAHPGEADFTAHVDFEPLRRAGPGPCATTRKARSLRRLGIDARAERLAQNLTGAALESHLAAHRRLTHPEEMGSLFKVLALTRPAHRCRPDSLITMLEIITSDALTAATASSPAKAGRPPASSRG